MLTRVDSLPPNEPDEQHSEGGWAVLKALIAVLVRREIITDDDLQEVLARALRDLDAQASDAWDPKALAAAKKLISAFKHQ